MLAQSFTSISIFQILEKILEYLPRHELLRCALVCKKWKAIVRQPKFFGRIAIGFNDWPAIVEVFERSEEPFPFQHIISDFTQFRMSRMHEVYKLCEPEAIRRLDVYLAHEYLDGQLIWLNKFPNLHTLMLTYDCSIEDDCIDLSGFQVMETVTTLEVGQILKCLDLVERLVPKLPNLKHIRLELHCNYDFYDNQASMESVGRLKNLAKKVEEIEVNFSRECARVDSQDDSFLGLMAIREPKIVIRRMGIQSTSMELVEHFAEFYPHLTHLKVDADYFQLDSTTMARIAKCFPQLEVFDIINATVWPIKNICQDLSKTKLKCLKVFLHRYAEIEFEFVDKVVELPHLEKLVLRYWGRDGYIECKNFSLGLQCCTNLTSLVVDFFSIGDRHLQLILCHLKKLRKLILGYCTNITDEGFNSCTGASIQELIFLEHLSLENGPNITDLTLIDNFKFKSLQYLKLENLPKLTQPGIEAVSANCPFIRTLILKNMSGLSDKALSDFFSRK